MAVFNPQVQPDNVRDPNYFKYSDSISQPKSDTSAAILGAAAGATIEGVANLADGIVKGIIKDDVYNAVDKERQDFAQALTNTRDYGSPVGPQREVASPVGPNGPVQAPVDILEDTNKPSVPTAINTGIAKASNVQAALNGNKISETTYYQRLGDIAKSMRTSYPGYREYIDQEISKITGVNPANAYISSIIQDLNRQQSTANDEAKFWRNKIVDSGYMGSDQMLQYYQRTGDSNRVMQWLSVNNGVRSDLALKKSIFESDNQDNETKLKNARDYATAAANTAATSFFYNTQLVNGKEMSPADISDKLADLSLNPQKANDVAYGDLSARYAALHTQAYNQTMKQLYLRPKLPDGTYGKSIADTLHPDETKKIVDNTVGALFGKTREFIEDKNWGPAFTLQRQAAATVNNKTMQVLRDPNIGETVNTFAVLNKLIPNFAPILTGKTLANGLDQKLSELVIQQGAQAVAQTGGKYTGVDGRIYSFKQSVEELEQSGNITQSSPPGQAFKNLLEVRQVLTQPDVDKKAIDNVVNYLYDPKVNKGSLDKLMDDYYDPTKRGIVKGRSSAFADLTAPEITSAIAKSSNTNWVKYSTWAKDEFATQVGDKVRELNYMFRENAKYGISYNAESKQFNLLTKAGAPVSGLEASYINPPYRTVTNLNAGLKNMANLAKAEGTNVDAYLFKVLKDSGFAPDKDIDGVPAQIMKAMIVGNGGKVKQ